jgi:hypothetical protein
MTMLRKASAGGSSQGDPLQRTERVAGCKSAGGGGNQRIHDDSLHAAPMSHSAHSPVRLCGGVRLATSLPTWRRAVLARQV